jgi:hypothetical protein
MSNTAEIVHGEHEFVRFRHEKITYKGEDVSSRIDKSSSFLVPLKMLFFSQPPRECRTESQERVIHFYRQKGAAYVYEEPPLVCAFGTTEWFRLAVVEGHHRILFAPREVIDAGIPCVVMNAHTAATLFGYPSASRYLHVLQQYIAEADNEFSAVYPGYQTPQIIRGSQAAVLWHEFYRDTPDVF